MYNVFRWFTPLIPHQVLALVPTLKTQTLMMCLCQFVGWNTRQVGLQFNLQLHRTKRVCFWFPLLSVTCGVSTLERSFWRMYPCKNMGCVCSRQSWWFTPSAQSLSAFLSEGVPVRLLFQKTNDSKEQEIKRRKKKEASNLEEKNPKKNRVPKQGWECWQSCLALFSCVGKVELVCVSKRKLKGSWAAEQATLKHPLYLLVASHFPHLQIRPLKKIPVLIKCFISITLKYW